MSWFSLFSGSLFTYNVAIQPSCAKCTNELTAEDSNNGICWYTKESNSEKYCRIEESSRDFPDSSTTDDDYRTDSEAKVTIACCESIDGCMKYCCYESESENQFCDKEAFCVSE